MLSSTRPRLTPGTFDPETFPNQCVHNPIDLIPLNFYDSIDYRAPTTAFALEL